MAINKENNNFVPKWSYDAAPESTNHLHLKKQYELFIDGEFIKPTKGNYFETTNPATEEK